MTKGNGWTPRALYSRWYKRGQHQVKKLLSSMPSPLEDCGAVAVEFAVIFPVLMLMILGTFEFGVAMTEKMQLVHVVQVAAELEAAGKAAGSPGTGLAWAKSQLPPPTSFFANPAPPCPPGTQGAQITGQWPVSLIAFSSLTLWYASSRKFL